MNYKPYKHLPPFKGMVLQNFPFIEEDFDSITNYQLLCKVVEYLKNVIANELTMEENVTNLYNEFVNLKNYIDNYFDNLDVQEEINNKLDEMTESGELTSIIGDYISPYLDEFNERLQIQDDKINAIENINPIPVSSTSDMTDTTKIYLNTTNGYWYYYNGTAWAQGGVYQSLVTNDYIEDGVDFAYNIPMFDNAEWVINTMSLTRASIRQSDGALVGDQGGARLRTGRLATFGSDNRGIVAKMMNSTYLIAPRWYTNNTSSAWEDAYIEGYDFTNKVYMGKYPYCAFVIKRADNGTISDEEIVTIRQNLKFYLLTDKTLTEENVPADAKAVGDAIREYTPYQDYEEGQINFNVTVNSHVLSNNDSDSYISETVKSVLMLPTTYTKTGNKTKLIMCCHGASGTITDGNWYNSNWMSFMNFLLSKGYAVFDTNRLNVTSDGFGKTYGSPVALDALYKAYQYIVKNYNIDNKIYIHGSSMGGATAQAFCYAYPTIIRACTCFAPANTCYSIWRSGTSIRNIEDANLIANCFGYADRNASKLDGYKNYIGYCTALKIQRFSNNNTLINNDIVELENAIENSYTGGFWFNTNEKWFLDFPVPIKIWSSTSDESIQTEFNECVINAIRNAGGIGYLKLVEGGNHTQLSYGQIDNMRNEMDYFLKRY